MRTQTEPWLRTDVKDRLRQLRDSLNPDDRVILVLRLDRGLSWNEVALVTLGEEGASAEALRRESARLRKRFQDLKEELRVRAQRAGLLEADGSEGPARLTTLDGAGRTSLAPSPRFSWSLDWQRTCSVAGC